MGGAIDDRAGGVQGMADCARLCGARVKFHGTAICGGDHDDGGESADFEVIGAGDGVGGGVGRGFGGGVVVCDSHGGAVAWIFCDGAGGHDDLCAVTGE